MDPGTALGAVSLTFQVFAGCIKGYQLLSEASGLEKNHQFFRIRFKTEQYRLLDWAAVAKLTEIEDTLAISKANRSVLVDILDQQRRLMHGFGRLDDRYRPLARPLLCEEHDALAGDDAGDDAQVDSVQSRFPTNNALLVKSLDFIKSTSKYPKRLRWAISDKAKIEELISRLGVLNDSVQELLSNHQMQTLNNQQIRTNYQIMQLNDKLDHLCEIVQAGLLQVQAPRPPAYGEAGLFSSVSITHTTPEKETNLLVLAQFKALRSAINSQSLTDDVRDQLGIQHAKYKSKPMRISAKEIEFIQERGSSLGTRIPAWYKPHLESWRHVWIEWNSVRRLPTQHPESHDRNRLAIDRFEALIELLREDTYTRQFRALKCLGYYVREASSTDIGYGLVFEHPEGLNPSVLPVSLMDRILDTQAPASIPSLTSRIRLMRALTESVEKLHAVNWLHKGFRSDNVLFFPVDDGSVDISQPFLSGFDYSRPESASYMSESPPALVSEDLYRHPAVQGGPRDDALGFGYKKQHDIYALGLILTEIAFWKPLHEILGFESLAVIRPSEAAGVKERLLRADQGVKLAGVTGDAVREAIQACITGPSRFYGDATQLQDLKSGPGLQQWFFDAVVARLEDVRI